MGPAVMLMPPHIRATFMPNPPLPQIPKLHARRKHAITGIHSHPWILQEVALMEQKKEQEDPTAMDTTSRLVHPSRKQLKELKQREKNQLHEERLQPLIEEYRKGQRKCGGEFEGMNCYNTLFVGRLAYEVTDRKLYREMSTFGPVKDIRLITEKDSDGKSRGYAFVEFENEEDMKRAYRAADAMKIEGREIVVDVERGHTVPSWLPRRLGGGLGGTRIGGPHENVNRPGRFDSSKAASSAEPLGGSMSGMGSGPPSAPYGRGGSVYPSEGPPPPLSSRPGGYGRGGGNYGRGHTPPPPPPMHHDYDRGRYGGGGGSDRDRKRNRSPSPDRRHGGGGGGGRRRYGSLQHSTII
jgi:U1 small nuclear ribonucleoprotein 70kDa